MPIPIHADVAQVWLTHPHAIRDPDLLAAYDALLNDEERTKRDRFRFERHRHECLVTRALIRTTLSRYTSVAPAAWVFEQNAHGRPALVAGQCLLPLRFNLSHTDGLIACAVTLGCDIGVDVENRDRAGETVAIADRFFAPDEVQALGRVPDPLRRERFFDYWTLKESYIKARGLGLAIPLEQFAFDVSDRERIRISFDSRLEDDPAQWQFALRHPTAHHTLAVAVARGRTSDRKIEIASIVPLRD